MTPSWHFEVEPTEEALRLDQLLVARLEAAGAAVSRSQLRRQIDAGAVTVNGAPAKAAARLRAGDRIHFAPPPPTEPPLAAEALPLAILHEDAQLVVLDKPPGLVVHPAAGHAGGTLVNALLAHCGESLAGIGGEKRPGIVHRLDKDTSGVMVVAKDEPTLTALAAQFKARTIDRRYLALVAPPPERAEVTLRTLYGRHPVHRKRFSSKVRVGKPAVTHVRVVERLRGGAAALVECRLETGRTHQIRVHLRDAGWPVLGDRTYGRRSPDEAVRTAGERLGRQALHAAVLGFTHPATGERLRFETPPPADFQEALAALRGGPA